ncbi:MAG: hypothetical protein DHS20C18_38900 [Saprospiraceae bacterium]|nr:MAG: hypothetical protein DHS20C18_38900 [Saprospiraceae bacterium]
MLPSIYDELGAENLQIMVNRFYDFVVEDPVLSPLFKTDMEVVRQKQLMFLTQFFGGPNLYNETYGHPRLRMRHLPHAITEDAAVAWLKCMHRAVESLDISEDLKSQVFNSFPRVAAHMVNQ